MASKLLGIRSAGLVALCSGFALLLAGCGSASSDTGLDTEVRDTDIESIEVRADDLYELITGGAVEREAVHFLEVTQLNASYNTCMAAAGFEQQPKLHPLWTGFRSNGTSGHWLGATHRNPSEEALAIASSTYLETEPDTREPSKARDAAESKCSAQDSPVMDQGNRPGTPKSSPDLTQAWHEMMDKVESELGPITPYSECMRAAGIDYAQLSDGEEGWVGLYLYLTAKMPAAPLTKSAAAQDDDWSSYLALEARAMEADESCREVKRAEGLRLLAPRLDEFEQIYESELERLPAEWAAGVAEAEKLGFRPPTQQ